MHRVFQSFIDGLAASSDSESLRAVLAEAGAALDLSCFAYLSLPSERILCRVRWPLKRLGAPRAIGKTIAVAGYLEVSSERLWDVREAGGLSAPAISDVGVRIGLFTPGEATERAVA